MQSLQLHKENLNEEAHAKDAFLSLHFALKALPFAYCKNFQVKIIENN